MKRDLRFERARLGAQRAQSKLVGTGYMFKDLLDEQEKAIEHEEAREKLEAQNSHKRKSWQDSKIKYGLVMLIVGVLATFIGQWLYAIVALP